MKIKVVDDVSCPLCGARWGHEDEKLDFPNRPKVTDENGDGWWKCYNPNCKCSHYLPESVVDGRFYFETKTWFCVIDENGRVEVLDTWEYESDEDMMKRVSEEVEEMMKGKEWVKQSENGIETWVMKDKED